MKVKTNRILPILGIIIVVLIISVSLRLYLQNPVEESKQEIPLHKVQVVAVKDLVKNNSSIHLVGRVVPEKKVKVISLNQGRVISAPFNIGDQVKKDQILAYLDSDVVKTGHLNSQINYTNMLNNLESVKRVADESIRQSEVGVEQAQQSIDSAKINLKMVQDKLSNTMLLQNKNYIDKRNQAIISFYSFLNTIENALDQVNYIIHVDEGPQLAGIAKTLSARDIQQLNNAKHNYAIARNGFINIKGATLSIDNIENKFEILNGVFKLTKQTVDDTINVLNNTVSSDSFSKISLINERTAFINLRGTVVAAQGNANNIFSSLSTLDISNQNNIDSLNNTISAAKKSLDLAMLGYNHSLVSLERARQSKNQQILGTQATVDNALGQLNLSNNQINDLVIKAPIEGRITNKVIEIGSEVRGGEQIAEISRMDTLKIEVNLSVDDVRSLKIGQEVELNNSLKGIISAIAPNADEITKKLKVDILFNNSNKDLISGTFVDVDIKTISNTSTITIPLSAINIGQNSNSVFIVDCQNNICIAHKKSVEIGLIEGDKIVIKKGLNLNNKLVIVGNKMLSDGEKVIMQK